MRELSPRDQAHLSAADGWLGLGDWSEANHELERITPAMRVHPDVLFIRWLVYAKAKHWELAAEVARALSEIMPDISVGFVHHAFALHKLHRTREAWNALLPVADLFPDEATLPYNLACYACQLGDLKGALNWLERALDLNDDLRIEALEDPDLEPLWAHIAEI